jgi:PleD family two-component response regulator
MLPRVLAGKNKQTGLAERIGVFSTQNSPVSAAEYVKRADPARHKAKNSGRYRVVV